MRNTLFCLLMVGYISTFAQNGTTFKVENLSKPEKLLFIKSYEDIYKGLILSDLKIYPYEIKEKNINVPFNIIAKSEAPDSLVNYNYNSFFYGMYQAYANHRPFVLSPDMIWLLINQGFIAKRHASIANYPQDCCRHAMHRSPFSDIHCPHRWTRHRQ